MGLYREIVEMEGVTASDCRAHATQIATQMLVFCGLDG